MPLLRNAGSPCNGSCRPSMARPLADSAPPRTGIHLPLEILAKPFSPPDLTRCPLYPRKRTLKKRVGTSPCSNIRLAASFTDASGGDRQHSGCHDLDRFHRVLRFLDRYLFLRSFG